MPSSISGLWEEDIGSEETGCETKFVLSSRLLAPVLEQEGVVDKSRGKAREAFVSLPLCDCGSRKDHNGHFTLQDPRTNGSSSHTQGDLPFQN